MTLEQPTVDSGEVVRLAIREKAEPKRVEASLRAADAVQGQGARIPADDQRVRALDRIRRRLDAEPTVTTSAEGADLLDAALALAQKGFRILPLHWPDPEHPCGCSCHKAECKSVAKHPRPDHGVKEAVSDLATIQKWWARWPSASIGIATGTPSGLWVLDFDSEEAVSRFEALQAEHGPVEKGVVCQTARGFHLYFRMPEHGDIRNSASKIAQGIDVRGTGGHVVVPPSPHPTGASYRWGEGRGLHEIAMVSAPDWLVSKVQAGHPPICADNPVAPLAAIPEGKRNATLASMGGAMRAVAFKEAEVRGALLAVNTDRCAPPLSDVEVAGIAASVANYAPSVPRAGGVFLPRDLIRQRDLWGRLIEWRMLQWLIAEATWTEEERGTCRLEVGQVLTSCRKIATACSWSENNVVHLWKPTQVKRALASLVKAGRIQVLVTGPGTLVTVLDYQQYQGFPLGRGGGLVRGLETA